MSSVGIDRVTGKVLRGWPHVVQSLTVLFTTRFASRVMRRTYGSGVPGLLGQNISPSTMIRFFAAIIIAVELWEPRFRVRKVTFLRKDNSPETIRLGATRFSITGEYRPRGHLGDPTPDFQERTFAI